MGLSRMLKINTPFIMIFLYVKLVSGYFSHLPELPDVKVSKFPKWGLGENYYKCGRFPKWVSTKNVTQYSYAEIQVFGYKKTPATFEVTSVCKLIEIS